MECSMPAFPVLYHLLELAQTHAHWISDTIQKYHLSSPSLANNLSQPRGLFPMSWLFALGDQSIRASASASVLPMNTQAWFPLGLTLLAVQRTLKSLLQHHTLKESILWCSAFFMVQHSHPYIQEKPLLWLYKPLLIFNTVSNFITALLPRSKRLLISWLQSPATVILELKKIKVWHYALSKLKRKI